jgi:hypothetical protein
MDPLNYAQYNLPKIEYFAKKKPITCFLDEAIEIFQEYARSCDAVTVDDEVIYNSYSKTAREFIQEDAILITILNDTERFFRKIMETPKSFRMMLYMKDTEQWFIGIYYNLDTDMFIVEFYKSK